MASRAESATGLLPPIADLLPHQPPMRLIDAVLDASDEGLWATLLLRAHSPFMVDGRIRSVFALEYLAQAAAAFFTLRALRSGAPGVRQGMLIAVPRLDTDVSHFSSGSRLLLHVVPMSRLPQQGKGMAKFRGALFVCAGSDLPDILPAPDTATVRAELSVYL